MKGIEDLRFTSVTQEQGEMIMERLTSLMEVMVTRLDEMKIPVGVIMSVSVGGLEDHICGKPFAFQHIFAGDKQCLAGCINKIEQKEELKAERISLVERGEKKHAAQHLATLFEQEVCIGKANDLDLMAALSMVITDEDRAKVDAVREAVDGEV